MDFCFIKLHFLTHLAVNAKCCVDGNCFTDMKALTEYGKDYLKNSGKNEGQN